MSDHLRDRDPLTNLSKISASCELRVTSYELLFKKIKVRFASCELHDKKIKVASCELQNAL